ncbi:MAG: M56 family metallopeptidase [Clostridia bacterium]|nr:M56 family metallopeptidase [Clostridia bacterium]
MEGIFLKIFNMSVSACWLILAILLLRIVLKKAPKWISCVLWGIAGLRLIMPFSVESIFSLVPSTQTLPQELLRYEGTQLQESAHLDVISNPIFSDEISVELERTVDRVQLSMVNMTFIWLIGIVVLFLYTLISFLRLKRKIGTAVLLSDNTYQSEAVVSPFVLGIIKPKIYLPFDINEQDMEHVIAHEKAHIRRKDHWWKPLGFAILALHWFNPLVWLGYVLLCRDIELACDEKVIKELNNEQRADYSQALLACSVNRRMIAACPLAFGEVSVKDRVKSVLNYKKPAFWIIIVAVVVSIIVSACFLTNPRTSIDEKLSVFIDMKIAEYNYLEGYTDENFVVTHHKVLGVDKSLNETTVYMWVMYNEYSCENGEIITKTSSYSPTVITAKRTGEHGHYELVEYWEPRDGSLFADDVKEKFPWYLQSKALNSMRYFYEQNEICENAAKEYFSSEINSANSSVIDATVFDIDGDGKNEHCVLTYGPTSGLYTVVFTATEVGEAEAEYINTFIVHYTAGTEFYESSDGKLKIKFGNNIYENGALARTEDVFFDVIIKDNNIVLKNGNEIIEYCGEQGIHPSESLKKLNAINNAVKEAIIEENSGKYAIDENRPEKYPLAKNFAKCHIMNTIRDEEKNTLTVYAFTLYEEYTIESGKVVNIGGGASPVEVVLEIESETSYKLRSYREINKPEKIEDYMPEDHYEFDDGEIMENLAQSVKIEAYSYYGYKEGYESSIQENTEVGISNLLVTHEEIKQMFSSFEDLGTEKHVFTFYTGFKRRVYHNGSFYYYCGYENEKDKVFAFFKGYESQPVYILDFNNTFTEYKNRFGKSSDMYDEYYSMILKIDR